MTTSLTVTNKSTIIKSASHTSCIILVLSLVYMLFKKFIHPQRQYC